MAKVGKRAGLYSPRDYMRLSDLALKATGDSVQSEPGRSPFRRDYGRLVHSSVFRRLQGKTQLFPGDESDFFRNRLTHSLEVAQIAKGLALSFNATIPALKESPIDVDLVEVAGLAHDLGHPPFGHNGEEALDSCMRDVGGFEGNAQTLRILTRIEKKVTSDPARIGFDRNSGADLRLGLDFTFRTLAAILKYDAEIPLQRDLNAPVAKGFYVTEADIVRLIKKHVSTDGARSSKSFRTIECSIMDVADDIAYSTYDLEDALKAGFLSPLSIVARIRDEALLNRVAAKVARGLPPGTRFAAEDVAEALWRTFSNILEVDRDVLKDGDDLRAQVAIAQLASRAYVASDLVCSNGYRRTEVTSFFVKYFMSGVELKLDAKAPRFSTASLRQDIAILVEVLKHFTYETQIRSRRVRTAEYRGYDIVREIFEALLSSKGTDLLPQDYRLQVALTAGNPAMQRRIVCDFIAGMTDKYAIEFHGRLFSNRHSDLFRPF